MTAIRKKTFHLRALGAILLGAVGLAVAPIAAQSFAVTRVETPGVGPGIAAITALDIDHDGDRDVVMMQTEFGDVPEGTARPLPVAIFRNEGDGTFSKATKKLLRGKMKTINITDQAILVADFNGDGLADLYLGDSGEDNNFGNGGQNQIAFGTAGGKLRALTRKKYPKVVDVTHHTATGDIDGDGDLDIIEANIGVATLPQSPGTLVFVNNGKGKFHTDLDRLPEIFIQDATGILPVMLSVAFVDVDRDGDLDLVNGILGSLTNRPAGLPAGFGHILENDGAGFFSQYFPGESLPLPERQTPTYLDSADINGDGWLDLLITTNDPDTKELPPPFIFLNNKNGGFKDASSMLPNGVETGNIRLADMNGDGWPDIVYTFRNDTPEAVIRLLINIRGKRFKPATGAFPKLAKGDFEGPPSIVTDVDGDGDLDILSRGFERFRYYENLKPHKRQRKLKKPPFPGSLSNNGGELSWNHSARATHYRIEVATDEAFSDLIFERDAYTGSSLSTGPLDMGTTYFWRIRGGNASGDGKWSSVASFAL